MAKTKYDYPEIRIRGIGKNTKNQLDNIAANLGIKTNDFMKMKVGEILNSYPDAMKLPVKQ